MIEIPFNNHLDQPFLSFQVLSVSFNGTELIDQGAVVMSTFYVPTDARGLEITAR